MATYATKLVMPDGNTYTVRDAEAYHPTTTETSDGRALSKENFTTALKAKLEGLGDILVLKGVVASASELPTTGAAKGDLYLVGASGDADFSEYVLVDATAGAYKWERLGNVRSVDLTDYVKTERVVAWSNAMTTTANGDDVGFGNTAYTLIFPAFSASGSY